MLQDGPVYLRKEEHWNDEVEDYHGNRNFVVGHDDIKIQGHKIAEHFETL